MFSDVIGLIPTSPGKNELGKATEVQGEPRQVFANKKSVRESEFYQAAAVGLKPEIMFEVRSFEYQKENLLVHDNKIHRVMRAYTKGELTELVCYGLVNEESC